MKKIISLVFALVLMVGMSGTSYAANTPTLSQSIAAGALTTDILNASRVAVASPSAALTAKTYSFDCQTGGSASTGTLGTSSERLYVMNPSAANNGWVMSIAATAGAGTTWTNGSATFDFNDAGGSGCADTATGTEPGGDTRPGQLTINPTAGTLLADCASCTITNVTKGSSTAFVENSVNSVTLLTAAAASEDIWRGYLTGATLSQVIPAEQSPGAYTLSMTISVVAS